MVTFEEIQGAWPGSKNGVLAYLKHSPENELEILLHKLPEQLQSEYSQYEGYLNRPQKSKSL